MLYFLLYLLEFKLAGVYLKLVPTDTAEELVLDAAREYFNSAPTFDNPNMTMAKSWYFLSFSFNDRLGINNNIVWHLLNKREVFRRKCT